MNVSSFFQGSALRFSVAGDGVSIDPATGELGITSEALNAGFTVTVTAQPSGGGESQSFKLRIAAAPEASAPVLLTAPELKGSGLVGDALEVVPGSWGGQPAPAIALQWLRDGVEIEGETGAAYAPQADDDGQEITCRVTAENASGALSAEPEAVRVTRAAPMVVDVLADVNVEKGADPVSVAAAAAFAGEGLRFAVVGGGAEIDTETGLLTLPTDVARDGDTVTVTATNSGGSAEASFLLTVTVIVHDPIPPAVITAPALSGTATIGSKLTVGTGLWSGLPLPVLALQWLRDGAEIDGATAASYVPVHTDDRCALRCRVTAANKAGSVAVETAALTVTYAAPIRVGDLGEEILDQGTGTTTIETAPAFSGENLTFSVAGAGAGIDAATGVLNISTEAALSETVTVIATNSGGAAEVSFLVTIEAPEFPALLPNDRWSAIEVRDVAPEGRRKVHIEAGVVPPGFELCLYSGLESGRDNTDWRRVMADGETYVTNSSMKVGTNCLNLLFWRRVADGAWAVASNEVIFPIGGLAATGGTGGSTGGTGSTGGEASQVLAAATQAALKAALDARIASASATEWILDLPNGNYGNLNLNGRQMPGKTILRAQNQALGAKFSGLEMSGCRNITFQFVDVDRSIGGAGGYGVRMAPAQDCGIEYSRIYVGGIVANSGRSGWAPNVSYAIELNNDGGTRTERIRIHMNLLSGPSSKHIYVNGAFDCEISDNVGENVGDDFIHMGWGSRVSFLRNWGPRAYYPDYNTISGWAHNDFIQCNSQTITVEGNVLRGNVVMHGTQGLMGNPRQGLFSSKTYAANWEFEDNILCTNSVHGITLTPNVTGTRAFRNTLIRTVDAPGDQMKCKFQLDGTGGSAGENVFCSHAGDTSGGSNSLAIVTANNLDASLAYFTNPRMAASFYGLRPIEGTVNHWGYAKGKPLGAYQRFRDVILGGAYPKIGPAAKAWKTWYDPKDEIRS